METINMSNYLLISLLKQYGIKKLVLSSGTRNIPFVTAVETDDFLSVSQLLMNVMLHSLGLVYASN